MSDLTPLLSSILVKQHSAKPIAGHADFGAANLDSFLREAYQIVWCLPHSSRVEVAPILTYYTLESVHLVSTVLPTRNPHTLSFHRAASATNQTAAICSITCYGDNTPFRRYS